MAEPNTALSAWDNFYVIVGSAGGALVGIQFVVMALIADMSKPPDLSAVNAFGTPNVVHFSMALLISAITCAPWPSLTPVAIALLICGLGGFVYSITIFSHARRQKDYQTEMSDWFWYAISPCVVYALLVIGAILLWMAEPGALLFIAFAALAMLFLGIHNAWDSVTYIVVLSGRDDLEKKKNNE
ncbi:MAG TPA: hypothetical protein VGG19_15205 [Tepidisphaeraceae bacterium]|jgi:hypothetical protein